MWDKFSANKATEVFRKSTSPGTKASQLDTWVFEGETACVLLHPVYGLGQFT